MANIFDNIDSKNKYKLLHSFRADTYKLKEKESIINLITENNMICLITKGSISIIRNNESGNNYVVEKLKKIIL